MREMIKIFNKENVYVEKADGSKMEVPVHWNHIKFEIKDDKE